jgi:hypothetical protein
MGHPAADEAFINAFFSLIVRNSWTKGRVEKSCSNKVRLL